MTSKIVNFVYFVQNAKFCQSIRFSPKTNLLCPYAKLVIHNDEVCNNAVCTSAIQATAIQLDGFWGFHGFLVIKANTTRSSPDPINAQNLQIE